MINETDKAGFFEKIIHSIRALFHIHYYITEIFRHLDTMQQRLEQVDQRLEQVDQRLEQVDQRLEQVDQRLEQTDNRLKAIEQSNRETKNSLNYILHDEDAFIHGLTDRLIRNRQEMVNLNRELSVVPTLWGNVERLRISPLASVNPCLFNTNSGEITIGDYTFAGSRVSILAGSHDYRLTGFLRRDAEITEGCDITIGKGVWLASGCTILGPCTIGDNAVIAAGAVVIPGTAVPANSIYGGIPAKEIGTLDEKENFNGELPEVKEAFERANGLLFVDGWTEKQLFPGLPVIGHFLTERGRIYVKEARWVLYYGVRELREGTKGTILFQGSEGVLRVECENETGRKIITLPCSGQSAEIIHVDFCPLEAELFLMMTPVPENE